MTRRAALLAAVALEAIAVVFLVVWLARREPHFSTGWTSYAPIHDSGSWLAPAAGFGAAGLAVLALRARAAGVLLGGAAGLLVLWLAHRDDLVVPARGGWFSYVSLGDTRAPAISTTDPAVYLTAAAVCALSAAALLAWRRRGARPPRPALRR